MRALTQRVSSAAVTVDGEVVGSIGAGLCAFVGITHTDGTAEAAKLAAKLWGLRVFEDDTGLTNLSAGDVGAEILVVSQFTLYADTSRGRRPSFIQAAAPEVAQPLVEAVVNELRAAGAAVATGRFRASMRVALVNDGPFTIMVEV